MAVKYLKTRSEFRKWLARNHDTKDELWVGYYKKHTEIPSITWPETVDECLCFGWIDVIRKTIDDKRYNIRVTLRRGNSTWGAVNIKGVGVLRKKLS